MATTQQFLNKLIWKISYKMFLVDKPSISYRMAAGGCSVFIDWFLKPEVSHKNGVYNNLVVQKSYFFPSLWSSPNKMSSFLLKMPVFKIPLVNYVGVGWPVGFQGWHLPLRPPLCLRLCTYVCVFTFCLQRDMRAFAFKEFCKMQIKQSTTIRPSVILCMLDHITVWRRLES